MSSTCPTCGTPVQPGAAFCDNCGTPLSSVSDAPGGGPAGPVGGTDVCPTCQAPVVPGQAFCDNCGAALEQAPAPDPWAGGPSPGPEQPGGTTTCPSCGQQVIAGMAFCDNCGASLSQAEPPPGGDAWQEPADPWADAPAPGQAPAPERAPAPSPEPALQPRLVIQGTNANVAFPADKQEIIIGREDAVSNHFPDVDLTAHGGDVGGVSRKHARVTIQENQCFIEDLDSVNYTFVNKQKLQPHNSQPLQDGDELRFGRVVATFHTQ